MYLIWISELGSCKVIFEGVVSTVEQADYALRALDQYHPEHLMLEYELVTRSNVNQVLDKVKISYEEIE